MGPRLNGALYAEMHKSTHARHALLLIARKRETAVFRLKLQFTWRKSATKYHCVNTVSENCKAFVGLFIRAKMVRGGRPLLRENLVETADD